MRVRGFTQDDAIFFAQKNKSSLKSLISFKCFIKPMVILALMTYWSTFYRPEKVWARETWDKAELR